MGTVWIDADAAPGGCKEIAFRAADRRKVDVVLVANRAQRIPRSPHLTFVVVAAGSDVADDHIAEQCQSGDLVVTADIPLAARAVARGAHVVTPYGEELDADNVRQRLSVRGRGTPEYIHELAAYLNQRIATVRKQARVFDPLRLSLLAGLQTISQELHEAAAIDGANAVQRSDTGLLLPSESRRSTCSKMNRSRRPNPRLMGPPNLRQSEIEAL